MQVDAVCISSATSACERLVWLVGAKVHKPLSWYLLMGAALHTNVTIPKLQFESHRKLLWKLQRLEVLQPVVKQMPCMNFCKPSLVFFWWQGQIIHCTHSECEACLLIQAIASSAPSCKHDHETKEMFKMASSFAPHSVHAGLAVCLERAFYLSQCYAAWSICLFIYIYIFIYITCKHCELT